jgi:hypothetical protein
MLTLLAKMHMHMHIKATHIYFGLAISSFITVLALCKLYTKNSF